MSARALRQVREVLEMVKFQHALFALPFAMTGMIAAADGLPPARTILLIVGCMVGARTAAMTWNRIADRDVDARNPRTRDRALPAGRVGMASAVALLLASAALFLGCAALLNRATLLLSPVALALVLGYSSAKRFTWASHLLLGACLALAPLGAWIAVTGAVEAEPLVLGLAVTAWTAGFDVLYACQDVDFDRAEGLHSAPARFGVSAALVVARAFHGVAFLALLGFGLVGHRGLGYFATVLAAGAVMAWSHRLVRPEDLSRVGTAFFEANVAVSVLILAGTAWDVFMPAGLPAWAASSGA